MECTRKSLEYSTVFSKFLLAYNNVFSYSEDWIGHLPSPYRPLFMDGFAPYGHPAPIKEPHFTQWDNFNNGPSLPTTTYNQHPLRCL